MVYLLSCWVAALVSFGPGLDGQFAIRLRNAIFLDMVESNELGSEHFHMYE